MLARIAGQDRTKSSQNVGRGSPNVLDKLILKGLSFFELDRIR